MSEDKTLGKIPHFDGHYDHWSELMENLLRAKGLWSVVKIDFLEPEEGTMLTEAQKGHFDDARLKDHQVMECGGDWFFRTRGRNNAD